MILSGWPDTVSMAASAFNVYDGVSWHARNAMKLANFLKLDKRPATYCSLDSLKSTMSNVKLRKTTITISLKHYGAWPRRVFNDVDSNNLKSSKINFKNLCSNPRRYLEVIFSILYCIESKLPHFRDYKLSLVITDCITAVCINMFLGMIIIP